MSPTEKQEFEQVKAELRELKQSVEQARLQQLRIPIDEASINVLDQALYGRKLKRITVQELRYNTLTAL